jgi:hypothetical protein
MNPAPEPRAFDMRSRAVEAPVPNLITEPTELPCGTLLVAMVGIICTAFTAIVAGEPHLWVGSGLFRTSAHCYLIQCWPLHWAQGFGTTCTAPLTNLRTEFPET